MAENDTKPKTGTRTWVRILLFASLALNLAIVGLVAGAVLGGGPPPRDRHADREFVTPYTRAFNDDQRRDLRRALRDGYQAKRAKDGPQPALVDGFRDAIVVLRTSPYDPGAMLVILEGQSTRAVERQMIGQQVLSDYLADLTPEERDAYATRLEEELEKFARKRDRWRKDR